MYLKTGVKVNVRPQGPHNPVSSSENLRGVYSLMHVLKKWRQETSILKLSSNTEACMYQVIIKYILWGGADMTL